MLLSADRLVSLHATAVCRQNATGNNQQEALIVAKKNGYDDAKWKYVAINGSNHNKQQHYD